MKFSLNWLAELVKLPSVDRLTSIIQTHSFEVEGVEEVKLKTDEKILVAEVVAWDKHPNADRLRVVTLKFENTTVGPVVCGASNFDVGDKVCLALPGANIPQDQHSPEAKPFTLTAANIRGVESQGMICSGYELGVADDRTGILILPESAKTGQPAAQAVADFILDVNVQATNRADVQSYYGFARELAAVTGEKVKSLPTKSLIKKAGPVKAAIENPARCWRYTGAYLTGVKAGPAPGFIRSRLVKNGIRPINNIVDITSYVMLELGLPLHAFDAKNLSSLVVRDSEQGETIKTLVNDKPVTLPEGILLITEDGQAPLAVAGVVGASGTRAVSEQTSEVFLEAAKFDPFAVRAASRSLGIMTEASSRFQKDLSVHLPPEALARAVELVIKYAGGKLEGVVDVFPQKTKLAKAVEIKLPQAQLARLLGPNISAAAAKQLLTKAGFNVRLNKNMLAVRVPAWRTDIKIREDLIEEIGRLYGYDKVDDEPLALVNDFKIQPDLLSQHRRSVEDCMTAFGFWENKNYAFVSESLAAAFGHQKSDLVELDNPADATQKFLRPSLLPVLASKAVINFRKYNTDINYFEIGQIFSGLRGEKSALAAVAAGALHPQDQLSFVKGALVSLVSNLGLPELEFDLDDLGELAATKNSGARIKAGGRQIGMLGVLSPAVSDRLGLKNGTAAFFELFDLENLLAETQKRTYKPAPKFPGVYKDLTFVVEEKVLWQDLERTIRKVDEENGHMISRLELIDIYRDDKKIGKQKKSITVGLTFQNPDRTLESKEAEAELDKIKAKLALQNKAVIR